MTRSGLEARLQEKDLADLVQKIASGDQACLTDLYDVTSRLIFGLVLRILPDRAAAEEVLLDVYTQVLRQSASYDSKRPPLAWLMAIARTQAIDRLRSMKEWQRKYRAPKIPGIDTPNPPNPEETRSASERQRIVRSAIGTLAPEQREAIEYAYYSGLSHSEIAARLGQPLGAIRTRTRLGMIKLAHSLESAFEESA